MRDEDVVERTEAVAAMPHVQRWIRRFKRLAKEMPPEVWVFAGPVIGSRGCLVMAHDEAGKIMMNDFENEELVSNSGVVDHIDGGKFDGGDF